MSKLQPTIAYEIQTHKPGEQIPEEMTRNFQAQLGREHILVANAINATIDDSSFFLTERMTSFIWLGTANVWKITAPTVAWTSGGTVNTITLNISGSFTVLEMVCTLNDGTTSIPVPNVDVNTAANEIMIARSGTTITLTSGGTDYSAYSGYVTVYYTKP
jgi:hypothetical protein